MVRAVFNHALNLEVIENNPITVNRFPKLRVIPRDKVLTQAESAFLLKVMEKEAPHLAPILRFALQVPCRKSELVNMRVKGLDLINNAIRIKNGTTKNDRGLWKPIPPYMVNYYRSLADTEYHFYRQEGKQCLPLGDIIKARTRCLKLVGIRDFQP